MSVSTVAFLPRVDNGDWQKPTCVHSRCRLGNGNQLYICMQFLETCSFTLSLPFVVTQGVHMETSESARWIPETHSDPPVDRPTTPQKWMSSSLNSKLFMLAPEAPGAGCSIRDCLDGQTHPHTVQFTELLIGKKLENEKSGQARPSPE